MIIIYGASWCGWCQKAKALAEQYQLDFDYRDVDNKEIKEQLRVILPADAPRTIPQIWWHGRHIGGHDDFVREIEETLSNYGHEPC
jgi:glutaredoxin